MNLMLTLWTEVKVRFWQAVCMKSYLWVNPFNRHHLSAALLQAVGEHGTKHRRWRGQHNLMRYKVNSLQIVVFHPQRDVAQLPLQAEFVHDVEGGRRVALQGVAEHTVPVSCRRSDLRLAFCHTGPCIHPHRLRSSVVILARQRKQTTEGRCPRVEHSLRCGPSALERRAGQTGDAHRGQLTVMLTADDNHSVLWLWLHDVSPMIILWLDRRSCFSGSLSPEVMRTTCSRHQERIQPVFADIFTPSAQENENHLERVMFYLRNLPGRHHIQLRRNPHPKHVTRVMWLTSVCEWLTDVRLQHDQWDPVAVFWLQCSSVSWQINTIQEDVNIWTDVEQHKLVSSFCMNVNYPHQQKWYMWRLLCVRVCYYLSSVHSKKWKWVLNHTFQNLYNIYNHTHNVTQLPELSSLY